MSKQHINLRQLLKNNLDQQQLDLVRDNNLDMSKYEDTFNKQQKVWRLNDIKKSNYSDQKNNFIALANLRKLGQNAGGIKLVREL